MSGGTRIVAYWRSVINGHKRVARYAAASACDKTTEVEVGEMLKIVAHNAKEASKIAAAIQGREDHETVTI